MFNSSQEVARGWNLVYFINLIFIFAVNVFFFFSGICLNSLVILKFLEVCTTSEEIMLLFHDNGFVLFRFTRGFN